MFWTFRKIVNVLCNLVEASLDFLNSINQALNMLLNRIQVESSDNHIAGIVGFRFILLRLFFHHFPVDPKFVLTDEIEELLYPSVVAVEIWRFAV